MDNNDIPVFAEGSRPQVKFTESTKVEDGKSLGKTLLGKSTDFFDDMSASEKKEQAQKQYEQDIDDLKYTLKNMFYTYLLYYGAAKALEWWNSVSDEPAPPVKTEGGRLNVVPPHPRKKARFEL